MMISRDNELVCNYRKCKQPLTEMAVATICQHIFCPLHGPQNAGHQQKVFCPACNFALERNTNDFVEIDLQPSDRFKSLILAGQPPEVIFDICSRAMGFYQLQQSLRTQFLEYVASKSIEKTKAMEKEFKVLLNQLKSENTSIMHTKSALAKECEELRSKLIISDQRLNQLERDYQNLKHASRIDHNVTSTEATLMNKSFANSTTKNPNWNSGFKRIHQNIQTPDSVSDYSPIKLGSRLDVNTPSVFDGRQGKRPSPFRFVAVGSSSIENHNVISTSQKFKNPIGNLRYEPSLTRMPNFMVRSSR